MKVKVPPWTADSTCLILVRFSWEQCHDKNKSKKRKGQYCIQVIPSTVSTWSSLQKRVLISSKLRLLNYKEICEGNCGSCFHHSSGIQVSLIRRLNINALFSFFEGGRGWGKERKVVQIEHTKCSQERYNPP